MMEPMERWNETAANSSEIYFAFERVEQEHHQPQVCESQNYYNYINSFSWWQTILSGQELLGAAAAGALRDRGVRERAGNVLHSLNNNIAYNIYWRWSCPWLGSAPCRTSPTTSSSPWRWRTSVWPASSCPSTLTPWWVVVPNSTYLLSVLCSGHAYFKITRKFRIYLQLES